MNPSRLIFFVALLAISPAYAAPEPVKVHTRPTESPGFWERAWGSAKKTTKGVWHGTKATASYVVHPFGGRKPSSDPASGWRQLQMSLALEPVVVKLPETRAIQVTVVLVNKAKTLTRLDFANNQRFEVLVKDETSKVLSRWSDDQKVEGEEVFVSINPNERLEYTASISTRSMVAGQTYQIEAFFPGFDQLRVSKVVVPEK